MKSLDAMRWMMGLIAVCVMAGCEGRTVTVVVILGRSNPGFAVRDLRHVMTG